MNHRQSDVHNFLKDRISPYPAYKDSGIEWLGRIPVHWEVAATKRLCHIINGGTPKSSEPRYWYGEVTWITPEDLGNLDKRNILSSKRKITSDGQQNSSATIIPAGSLVLSTRAPIGHIGIAGVNLCTNQGCRGLVMRHECSEVYHYFQFLAYRTALEELGQGSTFSELSTDSLGSFRIALPPLSEQRAIAAFLDRETAKIDALVAKKERLIELLQEKRVALISHAVTRGLPADAAAQAGLDPNVPMKDSRIEWLAEVPAHWEVVPFKRTIDYIEGPGIMAADFRTEGVPLLRISGIGRRWATLDGCNYLSAEAVRIRWSHFQVRSGDLLISGSASTGFCTEVDEGTAGTIPYTGIIIIRPGAERVSKNFARWMLLSDVFGTQMDLARSGSTIQHFGPSHLSRMRVLAPPLHEQRAIAAFLDRETAKIDALVTKVREAINHLKELRQALISAAVTGKIDVREAPALDETGNSTADGRVVLGASGGMGRHDETRRNDL